MPETFARLSLEVERVELYCNDMPLADQPAAMRALLRQLADMQAPNATVWLEGWDWSVVADTVAECLPALPHLRVGVDDEGALTDELLLAAMRMGPHMRSVKAQVLDLQSDYSSTAWPWLELDVQCAQLAQLLKLPAPAPVAKLKVDDVSLCSWDTVSEVSLRTCVHTWSTHPVHARARS